VEPFCFSDGGKLKLTITDFKLSKPLENKGEGGESKIGFLIRRNEKGSYSSANVVDYAGEGCIWNTKKDSDKVIELRHDKKNLTTEETIGTGLGGLYIIFFSNCQRVPVSFDLHMQMENVGPIYVGAGDVYLSFVFGGSTLAFMIALALWLAVSLRFRKDVHKIHLMMGALVAVKMVATLLQAISEHFKAANGSGSGWATAYYVINSLKGFMLFTVIVLVGTGWSLMKPFLSDRDKKILFLVLPLQLMVNIAVVIIEQMPPGSQGWLTWRDALHLFDIVCCCAILFPIVWSIRHLREASQTDGKAARNMQKLTLFREFYIMVVSYIYFTRIVVYLMGATLPCHYSWVSVLTSECATLLFYSVTGYKFRPAGETAYIALDKDEDDEDIEEGEQMTER
jgi:hypothetical protein